MCIHINFERFLVLLRIIIDGFILITTRSKRGDDVDKRSVKIQESLWIYVLQNQVRVRRREFPEIIEYLNAINSEYIDYDIMLSSDKQDIDSMSSIFQHISQVLSDVDLDNVEQNDYYSLDNLKQNLMDGDEDHGQLPVPIYSYIRPNM